MTKVVLFDLDGVLVDACDWHYAALNKALMEICGFGIGREEHDSTFNGLPTKQKLLMLQLQGRMKSEDFDAVWAAKQDQTFKTIKEATVQDRTKLELIEALACKGIRSACVTNSIRKSAEMMLDKIQVTDSLEFIIANEDVDNAKPAPDGYNKAMAKLGVTPDRTVIVEDSDKGYAAALASGCKDVRKVKNATQVNLELFKDIL